MRNKISVGGDKMSVVDVTIADARRMSSFLLAREFRGPGDTIQAAAYRVEQNWGVPATIIRRLQHRDVKDMLLSNWIRLKHGYEAACNRAAAAADHQKLLAGQAGNHAANSTLFALGTLLDEQEGAATRQGNGGAR